MSKKSKKTSTNTNINNKYFKNVSPEPNDGVFIENSSTDKFSTNGTVRYGEEADNCDL